MSDPLGRHTNTCPHCKGKGWEMVITGVAHTTETGENIPEVEKDICVQCQGKGFIVEDLDEEINVVRVIVYRGVVDRVEGLPEGYSYKVIDQD